MKLLVDSGNSRIKWATWDGALLGTVQSCPQEAFRPEREWAALPVPEAVVMANVAGEAAAGQVRDWIDGSWRCPLHTVVTKARAGGVRNGYDRPGALGVDRWAALIGARQLCRAPVCVVDAGSAITVDIMDAKGQHQGGYIAPGLILMRRALGEGTHGLAPDLPDAEVVPGPGRDTATGVIGGTALAAAGLIEAVLAQMPAGVRCILTGGDAERLLPLLRSACEHRPDLTLRGVAILAEGEQEVAR